jgi:hypothetical protein
MTSTTGNSFTTNVTPAANGEINARTFSPTDPFGAGNPFLELIDNGTGTPGIRGPASLSGTGFQLSFDFYDPSSANTRLGGEVSAGNRLTLGDGTGSTSSGTLTRTIDIAVDNGTITYHNGTSSNVSAGTYTEDEKHSIVIVGNYSAATISYLGDTQSVAPGRFDIWLDGALLTGGDDALFRNASVTSTTHFGLLGTGNVSISESYFDNFLIESIDPPGEPGDYNGDGLVDAADYVHWRTNVDGPEDSLMNRDPNNSGPINSDDYDFWRANFGNPPAGSGVGAVSTAAPEPATLALIGLFFVGWATVGRPIRI